MSYQAQVAAGKFDGLAKELESVAERELSIF